MQRRYGHSCWTSLIVAAAKASACFTILSENLADGAHYLGITAKDPFPTDKLNNSLQLSSLPTNECLTDQNSGDL